MNSRKFCRNLIIFATACLAASAPAQTGPSGSWDFTISGKRYGVALLEFTQDTPTSGTIAGFQVNTLPKPGKSSGSSDNPRSSANTDGLDPRTGVSVGGSNNSGETNVNFFGGAEIAGHWFLGPKNRLFGNFGEISQLIEGDTLVGKTNAVSFTGTFKPGKKITLRAESVEGKIVLHGLPTTPYDISGSFAGQGRRAGILYVDNFELEGDPMFANAFGVTSGNAADHTFGGIALLTSNNRLAVIFTREDVAAFDSLYGTYNRRRNKASLRGWSSDEERLVYNIVGQ